MILAMKWFLKVINVGNNWENTMFKIFSTASLDTQLRTNAVYFFLTNMWNDDLFVFASLFSVCEYLEGIWRWVDENLVSTTECFDCFSSPCDLGNRLNVLDILIPPKRVWSFTCCRLVPKGKYFFNGLVKAPRFIISFCHTYKCCIKIFNLSGFECNVANTLPPERFICRAVKLMNRQSH